MANTKRTTITEEQNPIMKAALEHFSTLEIIEIEVPEWECVIFCKPFTLAEKRKIFKNVGRDDIAVMADVLIMKALNADGERVFGMGDKAHLMNRVDPDVLSRISAKMLNSGDDVDEDADPDDPSDPVTDAEKN